MAHKIIILARSLFFKNIFKKLSFFMDKSNKERVLWLEVCFSKTCRMNVKIFWVQKNLDWNFLWVPIFLQIDIFGGSNFLGGLNFFPTWIYRICIVYFNIFGLWIYDIYIIANISVLCPTWIYKICSVFYL